MIPTPFVASISECFRNPQLTRATLKLKNSGPEFRIRTSHHQIYNLQNPHLPSPTYSNKLFAKTASQCWEAALSDAFNLFLKYTSQPNTLRDTLWYNTRREQTYYLSYLPQWASDALPSAADYLILFAHLRLTGGIRPPATRWKVPHNPMLFCVQEAGCRHERAAIILSRACRRHAN